jgi:tetraacyldisaccharide 4'-kinase
MKPAQPFPAGLWHSRSLFARLLWPASLAYGALVFVRRTLYGLRVLGSERMPVPVLVVGNIVAGGSGKTPLVLWIAQYLRAQGMHPGIVSRGYGGTLSEEGAAPAQVSLASEAGRVGDEPLLLARRSGCPVWVGRDRPAACRALLAEYPECDVLVLDDGLQHYRLRRDIELAVVDARGFGNGWMLPAGPLREPVSRLSRVDGLVLNPAGAPQAAHGLPAEIPAWGMRIEGSELVRLTDGSRSVPVAELGTLRVHAVAGIGEPARFFRHLEALGLQVMAHAFPDHHRFCAADLAFGDGLPVLMTEKDAVKCKGFAQPHFWMLPVRAEPDPSFGPFLLQRLRGLLHGRKTA